MAKLKYITGWVELPLESGNMKKKMYVPVSDIANVSEISVINQKTKIFIKFFSDENRKACENFFVEKGTSTSDIMTAISRSKIVPVLKENEKVTYNLSEDNS